MNPMNIEKNFNYPAVHTQIIFGFGAIQELPAKIKEFQSEKTLLVTDPGVVKAGIIEKITSILDGHKIESYVFDEVPQDSSAAIINRGYEMLKKFSCTSVIGIGGGSSMDTAKAIAIIVTNPGSIVEYAGLNKVKNPPLPIIAIPTTAGTGSEVSYWSVFTDDKKMMKISVGGELVFPKVAICDPELTITLPPPLTATTGMDALTHAIESYTNNSYQPISDLLTLRATELIGKYLVRAVKNGTDREARYGMLLGSMLAGLGMNPTRLGIVHALAMPLGSWNLKIPHGTANAILLPHVMEFNYRSKPEAYCDIAEALGENVQGLSPEEGAKKAIERIIKISREIGIPSGLGQLGLRKEDIPAVCLEAMKSGNIAVNPRSPTEKDLEEICLKAL